MKNFHVIEQKLTECGVCHKRWGNSRTLGQLKAGLSFAI